MMRIVLGVMNSVFAHSIQCYLKDRLTPSSNKDLRFGLVAMLSICDLEAYVSEEQNA